MLRHCHGPLLSVC